MDLSIVTVYGKKGFDSEYVLLKAAARIDLEFYALCDNTFNSKGQTSNRRRNFYWFPETVVQKNEYVVLWTKGGNYKISRDDEGNKFHNFYWGLNTPVWNDTGDKAVIFEINEIDTASVK